MSRVLSELLMARGSLVSAGACCWAQLTPATSRRGPLVSAWPAAGCGECWVPAKGVRLHSCVNQVAELCGRTGMALDN